MSDQSANGCPRCHASREQLTVMGGDYLTRSPYVRFFVDPSLFLGSVIPRGMTIQCETCKAEFSSSEVERPDVPRINEYELRVRMDRAMDASAQGFFCNMMETWLGNGAIVSIVNLRRVPRE